jgi:hypothetical protein
MALAMVAVLAVLACFQIALAAGAPLGRLAWGGQHRILAGRQRVGSVASVAVYALIATVTLDRAGNIDVVSDSVSRIAMWVVFAFFALSIIGNGLSRSPLERSVMVPTTVLLALLALLVALG